MAAQCPSNYTCEADGCCHKNGSDVMENWMACRASAGTAATSASDTGATQGGTGLNATTTNGTDSAGTATSSTSAAMSSTGDTTAAVSSETG